MTKNLQIIALIFILFATLSVVAQPTITATGLNPVLGEHYSSNTANYMAPGNAGANQNWDFSSMTATATSTVTALAPSATPYASNFPNANLASNDGTTSYGYIKTSSTYLQNMGAVVNNGGLVIMPYSDPEDLFHYPFTYNNTFTDPWAATFTSTGYTFYRTGTSTVTADGYGTLKTPAGTFTNVLRLHLVETYQDSAYIGFPYVITYQNDEYIWVMNGSHAALLEVSSLSSSASATMQSAVFTSGTVGVNDLAGTIESFSVYPNPATEYFTLNYNLKTPQQVQVKIFNTVGAEQASSIPVEGNSGHNEYKINVAELPEGIYFAQIIIGDAAVSTRRFSVLK